MIKAAFFDIDGTLVSLKTKVYPPSVKPMLERLRKNGVLCFVATGRSRFEIASEGLLDGLEFDGILTNNGQDAYDAEGNLLYSKPLVAHEAAAVIDWAEENHAACWVVGGDKSVVNHYDDRLLQAMESIHTRPPELDDIKNMPERPIYKIVLFLTREEMATPMKLASTSRCTQWFPMGHDIISRDGGKKNAMLDILARYGIATEESMAFGDSENDLEMLKAAGIGVAMGNGTEECKAVADYITADCDEDGLWKAMEHFGLL